MPGYTPKSRILDEPTILLWDTHVTLIGRNGRRYRRRLHRCGTEMGYRRHIAAREHKDDACKAAHAQYRAQQRGGKYTGKRRGEPQPCGTYAAAMRHRAKGEKACFQCRVAESEYRTANRRRPIGPKAPPTDTGACGTDAGYQRHHGKLQEACGPCREAHRARRQATP